MKCLVCRADSDAILCPDEKCSERIVAPEVIERREQARQAAAKAREARSKTTVKSARQWVNPEDFNWFWGEGRM